VGPASVKTVRSTDLHLHPRILQHSFLKFRFERPILGIPADATTVTPVEDFENDIVHTNIIRRNLSFLNLNGTRALLDQARSQDKKY
jgi:hypothetical protein